MRDLSVAKQHSLRYQSWTWLLCSLPPLGKTLSTEQPPRLKPRPETGMAGDSTVNQTARPPHFCWICRASLQPRALTAVLLLFLHSGNGKLTLTWWSAMVHKDKEPAQLFRAPTVDAFKPLSATATLARFCALPATSLWPPQMGLLCMWAFPHQSHAGGSPTYTQCILLCKLQQFPAACGGKARN